MASQPHKLVLLPNRSYQAVARSEIKKIAQGIGLSAKRLAELEIVISEITSNVVKHTSTGAELLIKRIEGANNSGLEIICIDKGPGMESTERMMEDGISSTKTLGQGLGAIKRLSNEFDIYSLPGWGTILIARIYNKPLEIKKPVFDIGVIMLAKEGEQVCGDDYYYVVKGNNLRIAVCDGLGHGEHAHAAAVGCMQTYIKNIQLNPGDVIREVHNWNKRTRGAVIYTMHIDFNNKQAMYCGVGNISAKIISAAKPKYCISYNGIVGHSVPSVINNHVLQCNKNDLFIIHSDGLSSRWDLQKYPNILKHDRSILAAALYKDFTRKTDDVTVAVISQANR